MKRDIKFRLWDYNAKAFITNGFSVDMDGWAWHDDNDNSHRFDGSFELMQYTGLKDKNGVEIYEGDIVRSTKRSQDQTHTGVIKMPKSCWVLEVSPNRWYRTAEYSTFEVLGNIYENPELLTPAL